MLFKTVSAALVVGVLLGCQSTPRNALQISQSALATRAVQTHAFHDVSELQIMSASVAVLQDMGYAIDEIEKPLGVLSASKRADATREAQVVGRVAMDLSKCLLTMLVACSNKNYKKTDDVQDIRLTLVVLPAANDAPVHSVRVTMQRVVFDRAGRVSGRSTLDQAEIYQAFFAKLDKSVQLERTGD